MKDAVEFGIVLFAILTVVVIAGTVGSVFMQVIYDMTKEAEEKGKKSIGTIGKIWITVVAILLLIIGGVTVIKMYYWLP